MAPLLRRKQQNVKVHDRGCLTYIHENSSLSILISKGKKLLRHREALMGGY